MTDLCVMTECYADTLLIETLVPPVSRYNHKHSCYEVQNEMTKGRLKDKFAVGIIDADKKRIAYMSEFEVIDKIEDALILWRHKSKMKHHYIIQLCPALEGWVLNVCKEEGIDLNGLPSDIMGLRKYTKVQSSLTDPNLVSVFGSIANSDNNDAVRKLKGWIKILKEKNYQADIKELINV
jgi:hypothetical protein